MPTTTTTPADVLHLHISYPDTYGHDSNDYLYLPVPNHPHLLFRVAIIHDSDSDPLSNNDGFWPSLLPSSPGYIGPRSLSTYRRHLAHAKHVLEEFQAGNWFYVGLSVDLLELDDPSDLSDPDFDPDPDSFSYLEVNSESVWGLDYDYPKLNGRIDNSYLLEILNDLLSSLSPRAEAQTEAEAA